MGFWKELIVLSIFVALIGGIASYAFGMVFGMATAIPLWGTIQLIIGVVLAVMLAKYGNVDNYNLFRFVILLGVVGAMGSVIITFVPAAAPFILSVGAFSVNALVWAFVYILLAEMVYSKIT